MCLLCFLFQKFTIRQKHNSQELGFMSDDRRSVVLVRYWTDTRQGMCMLKIVSIIL